MKMYVKENICIKCGKIYYHKSIWASRLCIDCARQEYGWVNIYKKRVDNHIKEIQDFINQYQR